jgi:hypothetical protein
MLDNKLTDHLQRAEFLRDHLSVLVPDGGSRDLTYAAKGIEQCNPERDVGVAFRLSRADQLFAPRGKLPVLRVNAPCLALTKPSITIA